jgi:NADPH:quinone reductase-like Zn-dependent oxidoreductase
VVDYNREDFTKNNEKYDVTFDTVGKTSFSGSMRSLNEDGLYLLGDPTMLHRVRGRWSSRNGSKKVVAEAASYQNEDLVLLKELVEAGKMKTVNNRRYPLEKTAEAHKYVDTGEKAGNVIITIP